LDYIEMGLWKMAFVLRFFFAKTTAIIERIINSGKSMAGGNSGIA
jgi:hypothetical protein